MDCPGFHWTQACNLNLPTTTRTNWKHKLSIYWSNALQIVPFSSWKWKFNSYIWDCVPTFMWWLAHLLVRFVCKRNEMEIFPISQYYPLWSQMSSNSFFIYGVKINCPIIRDILDHFQTRCSSHILHIYKASFFLSWGEWNISVQNWI